MKLGDRLRRVFGQPANRIRVTVLVKGRIGEGWHDTDRVFRLQTGSTLADLMDEAERNGVGLRDAIAASPHLAHTLMLNGERCPVDDNLRRVLADGDEIYLLAPLAGG